MHRKVEEGSCSFKLFVSNSTIKFYNLNNFNFFNDKSCKKYYKNSRAGCRVRDFPSNMSGFYAQSTCCPNLFLSLNLF